MANASIKAAFEQFWAHVIARTGDTIAQANAYTENALVTKMNMADPIGSGTLSMNSTAAGNYSTAVGYNNAAVGNYSTAMGYNNEALGEYSYAAGYNTSANDYQYVVGRYNRDTTAPSGVSDTTATAGVFMVGVGISDDEGVNGFRVNPAGKVYAQATLTTGTGADYAEYFEWADGNPNNEDRRGRFVTLDGGKIRYANAEDDYILGIISANPAVLGDAQMEIWHEKYLNDVYGARIEEVVKVEETEDEFGNIVPAHTERRWVLNPDYNPDEEYVSREERIEWDAVGIVGKLVIVDDGTCEVNDYCYPSVDGIATASESKTAYRVMERLDDTHVRVFVK